MKVSDAEIEQIADAVKRGGGDTMTPTFLGWLAKNTANQAQSLQDVLTEDVDELIAKLEQIAAKRNRAGAS
jgi:predicted ArsR family transcriptional regulator